MPLQRIVHVMLCARGRSDASQPTAVREIEEELGVGGELAKDLKLLFTLACTNKGSTKKHGAFLCNEYQDIYLLPVQGTAERSTSMKTCYHARFD